MNENDLTQKIKYLISLKKEGDYWDYKQEWHENNERLIHDILCFANTQHDHDCYLIIGVTDNGEILGLNESQQKQQANIIDILRSCKFAGDNVPVVKLEKVTIEGKSLDVLVILNSDRVPFYLDETNNKHKKIREGYIYSRVGDSNTPILKNATVLVIESLWKKRFGINLKGLERFSLLLSNPNDWVESEVGYYHLYNPEYSLEFDDLESAGPKFYSLNMDCIYCQMVSLKYYGTILKRYQMDVLGVSNYRMITPDLGFIRKDRVQILH
ncbi:ATP-binding protein [Bacillus haynesii]|uniref:ATP-binding protein n=1 Tax=Bacillus haynesii TaxID=1925021 RepID=UPI00227E4C9F|nr:ATP-binding protein [Bacillus haynesii]MCY9263992.1 ATP-binding protein [Bacillus haynesii]MEC1531476.1 ATP-binding protein [Bacillus haynesii]